METTSTAAPAQVSQITATAGPDVINGSEFADTISGGGGDDTLSGGAGADVIDGGTGNDVIDGGDGDDIVRDGEGQNTVTGGAGNDQLYGGSGKDTLIGGAGDDLLEGGAGDDLLGAGGGNDTVYGGEGNDNIWSEEGDGLLDGGDGDDSLAVYGVNAGVAMTLAGGAGNDQLHARIDAGSTGAVILTGGGGSDTFSVLSHEPKSSVVISDFSAADGDVLNLMAQLDLEHLNKFGVYSQLMAEQVGQDTVIWYDGDGTASGTSWQRLVTLENVALSSLTSANFIFGLSPFRQDGAWTVYGTGGGDVLLGGMLDDFLNGEDGDDTMSGGAGADTLNGGSGNDILRDDEGKNVLHGGDGNDQLFGGSGIDWLIGGLNGDDFLDGGDNDDYLQAWGGRDTLLGGAGNDQMDSTDSTGQLSGGDGDDWIGIHGVSARLQALSIDGGAGNDHITFWIGDKASVLAHVAGGSGSDTFALLFASPENTVTIGDFSTADGDVLDLRGTIPQINGNPNGGQGFMYVEQEGSDTVIWYDRDGVTGTEYAWQRVVTLTGVDRTTLTSANFQDGLEIGKVNISPKLEGTGDADVLAGGMFAELLSGGAGNDSLDGGGGSDTIDGGAGTDFAFYAGDISQYQWSRDGDAIVVRAADGSAATDTLLDIERVGFAGRMIAFDVGADGNAGEVYRLYQAAFGRTPDNAGLAWWIKAADAGMTLEQISGFFMRSNEFETLYGAAPDNAQLVRALYVNALHREPDDAGLAYWTMVLDKGYASPEAVLIGFSESRENQEMIAKVIGAGIELGPWS